MEVDLEARAEGKCESAIAKALKEAKKHAKSYINRFSDQYRFYVFDNVFIKIGIMAWIRIDFALLIAYIYIEREREKQISTVC